MEKIETVADAKRWLESAANTSGSVSVSTAAAIRIVLAEMSRQPITSSNVTVTTCGVNRCLHNDQGACTREAVHITRGGECGQERWREDA